MRKTKKTKTEAQLKRQEKIWIAVGIVLLLIFVWTKISGSKNKTSGMQEQEIITLKEDVVKKHIQISGHIEAAQEQILQSPGEGIVKKVNIKEGDLVKKGQLIFSLDSSLQEMQVAQQEFAIEQEKVNGRSIRLKLMQKELALKRKQLADRSIYAKFDGVAAMFSLTEGSYAQPKDSFGVIIDRSFLKSTVAVSERDASKLAVGQEVLLEFVALPDVEVKGEITAYPSIAKSNSSGGETVVEAKLLVKNPPKEILPGYSFYGKIVYGKDEKVILISQQAIFYDKGKPYVNKILENKEIEKVQVEIEPYMEGVVKLVSGDLKAGDQLQSKFLGGSRF